MILVTGASGFIGTSVCAALRERSHAIRAAVRTAAAAEQLPRDSFDEVFISGELSGTTAWDEGLRDIEAIVHLAARVHVMHDRASDPQAEFRKVNVDASLGLARQARDAGVPLFVFVSSIKVNGESTSEQPFRATDDPAPVDEYGRSKLAAERGLRDLERPGFRVAIVRPPLVYGPGVKANFRLLLNLANSGLPLPFGAVRNQRSFVNIWNLADFIARLVSHPRAAGQTWLVSDGEDLSTPHLVRQLAAGLGRKAVMIPVPVALLRTAFVLVGRAPELRRLTESLRVDISPARELLGWSPPVTASEGLVRTALAFAAS